MNSIWGLIGAFVVAGIAALIHHAWIKAHIHREETLTLTQCTITQLSKFAAESHWLELYRVISGCEI